MDVIFTSCKFLCPMNAANLNVSGSFFTRNFQSHFSVNRFDKKRRYLPICMDVGMIRLNYNGNGKLQ